MTMRKEVSSSQKLGKRKTSPRQRASRARESCQEPLAQTRGGAGLNKPC